MARNTALLIVDVQVGLLEGKEPAYRANEVLDRIRVLIGKARRAGAPVIYMQHQGKRMRPETSEWQIHPSVAPQKGDVVIHKQASDSFYRTLLQHELDARGVKHLVIVGCKTEYCVDTTSRRATTLGYNVTLVSDAHTTTDNGALTAPQIITHHNHLLDGFDSDHWAVTVKAQREVTF